MTISDFMPFLPALCVVGVALSVLLVGVYAGNGATLALNRFSGLSLLIIAGLAFGLSSIVSGGVAPMASTLNFIVFDGANGYFQGLILLTGAISLVMAGGFLKRDELARPEYAVLMLLSIAGMMVMVSSGNFLTLYLGLELQSLPLYVLAAFNIKNRKSNEAGLKYFMLGALASGLLLFGISLVYGYTGTLDYATVAKMLVGEGVTDAAVTARPELVAGAMLIVGALAFKLAAVPFHMWAPDVYEGAPTPVTTFFAVVAKLAAFGIMVKVLAVPFAPLFAKMQIVLVVLSALSLTVGALGGLGQNNLKRLLAYSSIGHVGFGLMAIAAGGTEGLSALIVYLAIYAVMSLGTFGVLLMLRSKGQMVETISNLAGLSKSHPWVGLGLALLMFSMAGIPPLLGFFSKLYVFMAAYNGGLIHLAILAAVCSVISAYYYLRVIKAIYVDEPAEGVAPLSLDKPYDTSVGLVVFVAVLLNVIGLLLVSPLAASITQAVSAAPLP